MATIRRLGRLRHLSTTPTRHVVHLNRGRVRHCDAGLSFWFDPWSSTVSEVPIDDRELSLVARARTADLQDVTAQVTVSYRFSEPADVVQHIDFAVDPDTGSWTGNPLEQVSQLLGELASGHVMDAMAGLTLREAVSSGGRSLREAIAAGLASDGRLTSSGISVLGARVRSVRGDADMERFLQTPAREEAQTEADRSTFERRALAVDRERAIAENELANRIELAVREQQLVSQEGANARTRAEEAAAAAMIEADADLRRSQLVTEATAQRVRQVGEAEAAVEAAKIAGYAQVDHGVLAAMVARELAGALPEISNLTITPDLLTGAMAALTGGSAGRS